jgi:2-polyprenyl-6-hydroxyphenyl methylase/3-demethylubiquinone-9 3-methyltransferase
MPAPLIDNQIYERDAAAWWDPEGHLHLLKGMIPCRLEQLGELVPQGLADLEVLDLGCGGGLFSEALAQLGARVTGVDPSAASLETGREHARSQGLEIRYLEGRGEAIPVQDGRFDLLCCCDVLEHVDDLDATIAECARALRPGGLFFFDTINRTLLSRLLITGLLQDWPITGVMPDRLHIWHKFIVPDELIAVMDRHRLRSLGMVGISPDLGLGANLRRLRAVLELRAGRGGWSQLGRTLRFRRSRPMALNYMGWARKLGQR